MIVQNVQDSLCSLVFLDEEKGVTIFAVESNVYYRNIHRLFDPFTLGGLST